VFLEPSIELAVRNQLRSPLSRNPLGDNEAWFGLTVSVAAGTLGIQEEQMTRRIAVSIAALILLLSVTVLAQKPTENVSAKHHPNLAAAQRLSHQAWEKIVAAQKANEWDMQGHAQKAKELLDQVNAELKLAAEAANKK
jgi:hypothetical protein